MTINLIEIDENIFVVPAEVVAVEDNGYWAGSSPSDNGTWVDNGSVIILKNGRKIYTKLTSKEVMGKLKGDIDAVQIESATSEVSTTS